MKIPSVDQALFHNNVELKEDMSLKDCGIGEDDILLVRQAAGRNAPPDSQAEVDRRTPPDSQAEVVRRQILRTPELMSRLAPRFQDAAMNNPTEFARLYNDMVAIQRNVETQQVCICVFQKFSNLRKA
jgi:hypothetical protein